MFKADIENYLTAHGWKKDSYGHFKLTITESKTEKIKEFRCKMQGISIRLERKVNQRYPKKTHWFKMTSDYYKNIVIDETGKLRINKVRL